MAITDYTVVIARSENELETKVNALLANDFAPVGGVHVSANTIFRQAVAKEPTPPLEQ